MLNLFPVPPGSLRGPRGNRGRFRPSNTPAIIGIAMLGGLLTAFILDILAGDPLGLVTPGVRPTPTAQPTVYAQPAGFVYKIGQQHHGHDWPGESVSGSFFVKPGEVLFYSLSSSDSLDVSMLTGSAKNPISNAYLVIKNSSDKNDYHSGYLQISGTMHATVSYVVFAGSQLAVGQSLTNADYFAQGLPYPGFTTFHDPKHKLDLANSPSGLKVVYDSDIEGPW